LSGFSLRIATITQVLLLAFCTFQASRTLAQRLGIWTGIATAALILAFARIYQPTTLSESLGVSVGALALSLLYRGVADRGGFAVGAGLGALSLGMAARAGAIFAIPCILVAAFVSRRVLGVHRLKPVAAALALVLLGFGWTSVLNRAYGTGG